MALFKSNYIFNKTQWKHYIAYNVRTHFNNLIMSINYMTRDMIKWGCRQMGWTFFLECSEAGECGDGLRENIEGWQRKVSFDLSTDNPRMVQRTQGNWSFVWRTSVIIRLPSLREKICSKLANLGISASRFSPWRISWLAEVGVSASRFPPADLLSYRFGESAGRFGKFCQQIPLGKFPDWQSLVFLPADFPPSRFTEWQIWWICWQIWVYLLADFPPADFLTGRFWYFCWQICTQDHWPES